MKSKVLMCLLIIGFISFNAVNASVNVKVNKEQYSFSHEPQLVEVLAPIASQQKWYWPRAALYQTGNKSLEETRQLLLISLTNLIDHYQSKKPELAMSLIQLQTAISSWRLGKRLSIKIDYDLARIDASANPRIPKGEYILDLTLRMDSVQLFGAVNNTINVPHLAHSDVSEYITNNILTSLANQDIVMLIQADGREISTPVSYWNKGHQEAMPGSQIFIPFKESLFQPEFGLINQRIMTLALNRVW
jgi:hypothetical protein